MPGQEQAADPVTFTVREDDGGRRLDRVLRKLLPGASLARIYTGLRHGEALVDGRSRDAAYRVREGERIGLSGSLAAATRAALRPARAAAERTGRAEAMLLYRSRDIVVFNKPPGLPVHGRESLASAAEGLLSSLAQSSLSFRPGPVHRLDRDTSGLVFFAVSLAGARVLSELLRNRLCEKTYLALLEGDLAGEEEWRDVLARDRERRLTVADEEGDACSASASPLLRGGGLTLARVRLESGRTHQIRAQAALRGHPLHGDTRYGGRPAAWGYVLHAARFRLPPGTSISERLDFTAPLPPASLEALQRHFGSEAVASALEEAVGSPALGGEA